MKQREEIKSLKSAVLFPDVMNSQVQNILEKQGSELKQAKQLIPNLQRQVTSLTGQLQSLAEDLAQVKINTSILFSLLHGISCKICLMLTYLCVDPYSNTESWLVKNLPTKFIWINARICYHCYSLTIKCGTMLCSLWSQVKADKYSGRGFNDSPFNSPRTPSYDQEDAASNFLVNNTINHLFLLSQVRTMSHLSSFHSFWLLLLTLNISAMHNFLLPISDNVKFLMVLQF